MATRLSINSLYKAYDTQVVFDNAELTVSDENRIGVIGRNGAGKSTLFNLIAGTEEADRGELLLYDGTRLGYLAQNEQFEPGEKTIEYLIRTTNVEEWQAAKLAARFALSKSHLEQPVTELSGGLQMRAKLVSLLLKEPNLLLLDEPTNYLDLTTQLLLERYLPTFRGSYLIISHDREFLKNTCTETLDVANGKLTLYAGPIEEYLAYRQEVRYMQERYNRSIDKERAHLQTFVDRFRYKASKAKQAQSKLKQIARLKRIELEVSAATATIDLPAADPKKGPALTVEHLAIGYHEKALAQNITFDIDRGERVAILGDNGQGKSTLLKTLAGRLPTVGGKLRWSHNIRVAYFAQESLDMLDPTHTVRQHLELKAPHASNEMLLAMAGQFLFKGDDLDKSISVLSGGERSRLALAGILLNEHDVLLLDEPTNHLDVETVEELGLALRQWNGTVFVVSHNRTFINLVATTIIEVRAGTVTRYPYTYEEYVYYLSENMAPGMITIPDEKTAVPVEKHYHHDPEERYKQLKRLKREQQHLELDIKKLEEEKTDLLKIFEKRPTEYAPERQRKLAAVAEDIVQKETAWIQLQERIEQLA